MSTIKDLMTADPIVISSDTSAKDAIELMRAKNIGSILITENDEIKGIFTERDLLKKADLSSLKDLGEIPISELMTSNLMTVPKTSAYVDTIEIMKKKRIRHLPVTENDKITGIVSLRDLLDHYREQLEYQLEVRQKALQKNFEILKASEEKFKTIFDNSVVAIMQADKDERLTTWNPFTEELLGFSCEELEGKHVKDLYPAEEWARIRAENIREKGRKDLFETKIVTKDGAIIDIDISISVFRDGTGGITGSIAVMRDNTNRKKMEEELKRSREQLEELVQERTIELELVNKKLEILVADRTDRIDMANQKLEYQIERQKKTEKELEIKMKNLEVLYSVSKALNFASDLKKILLFILDKARNTLNAEKASLMLLDEKTDELVVHVVRGIPPSIEELINSGAMECTRIKRGEGVAGEVAVTKKHILIDEVGEDDRFKKTGESFVRSILCTPLIVNDEVIGVINLTNKKDGGKFGEDDADLLSILANQSAVTIHNAKLYHLAITDGLTQLRIHRYFQQRLEEEIIRSAKFEHPVSLIMLDIDHFKDFNDTYGHQQGDIVLIETAKVFRLNVREVDIAARYGGEEFAVIMPETGPDEALELAEKIRVLIEEHQYPSSEGKLNVTISLGVATYPQHAKEKETLIAAADKALYSAKEAGRNCVKLAE